MKPIAEETPKELEPIFAALTPARAGSRLYYGRWSIEDTFPLPPLVDG